MRGVLVTIVVRSAYLIKFTLYIPLIIYTIFNILSLAIVSPGNAWSSCCRSSVSISCWRSFKVAAIRSRSRTTNSSTRNCRRFCSTCYPSKLRQPNVISEHTRHSLSTQRDYISMGNDNRK